MKAMNWITLDQWVGAGLGQGHLDDYQSFLRIARSNFPRRSNQVVGVLPGFKRRFNFLARAERFVALVCIWLRVLDLREQYPLWPWAHAHPLADWPLHATGYTWAPSLLDIARDAGIQHGTFPGSEVPYVGTTDLLLTVGSIERPRLVAIACKPKEFLAPTEDNRRTIERLELERRYFKAIGVRHVIIDSDDIARTLLANLEALAPDDSLRLRLENFALKEAAADTLSRRLEAESIRNAVWATSCDLNCDPAPIWDVFQQLAWQQDIDIDLTQPIHRSLPLVGGGRKRRAELAAAWLGEVSHG